MPSAEGSVFGTPKSSSMENTLGSGSTSANGIAGDSFCIPYPESISNSTLLTWLFYRLLLSFSGSVSSISGGNKNGPVVTTAMIHWDKALTELPASMTVDDTEYGTNEFD